MGEVEKTKAEVEPTTETKPSEEIEIEKGQVTPAQIEEIKAGKYYTIKQLASELGYSIAWITYLCQKGRIKAMKPLGGNWRIPPSEVDRIRKEGTPPLPRTPPQEPSTEIKVEGKHLTQVLGKEKEEKEKDKIGWPFNIFLE